MYKVLCNFWKYFLSYYIQHYIQQRVKLGIALAPPFRRVRNKVPRGALLARALEQTLLTLVGAEFHYDEWVAEVTFTDRQKYTEPNKSRRFRDISAAGIDPESGKLPDAALLPLSFARAQTEGRITRCCALCYPGGSRKFSYNLLVSLSLHAILPTNALT